MAMIQTLASRAYPPSAFEEFGLLIADECFPFDQSILTERGPAKIGTIYEEWCAGKEVRVLSFDEKAQTFSLRRVTHAWEKRAVQLVEVKYSESSFKSTPNHRVLTTDGWKHAGGLCPGDLMVARLPGHEVPGTLRVSSVEAVATVDERVYDLEVEGTHTFVCIDEGGIGPVVHNCHHIAARTFSKVMFSLALPLTLGLSATPDRRDGLRRVIEWFLGPVVFESSRKTGVDVRLKSVRYECEAYKKPTPTNRRGDTCFTSIVSALVTDLDRSRKIVDEIRWLVDRDRDVLVLSHRRAHCVALAALATSRGIECSTYLGGDKTLPSSRVVMSTYALTAEGFDSPRFTGLVLATPASDITQAVGRVMRGTGSAVVVDFTDAWGMLFAMANKRRAQYRRAGIDSL